jgi:hypothetical protein
MFYILRNMLSIINTKIKHREKSNDIFITPLPLAKFQINMIETTDGDIWFDPFRNSGSYYNQFPTQEKVWCEILDGEDFFTYNSKIDIICSNPPYSILDKVFEKSVDLNPKVISYLIGINNLTAKRIKFMNDNGYGLTKLHITKVFKWFGMSVIVQFEKNKENIISFDRIIWK